MSKFEQRVREALQNSEFMAGFWEMDAEFQLMQAFDEVLQREHITRQELTEHMGRKYDVTTLFTLNNANPTLQTLIELLSALHLTADITLRRSEEGEGPIRVKELQV